jgi:hypothetical protein
MRSIRHIVRDRFKQQYGIFFGRKFIDNSKQVKNSGPFPLARVWKQS